MTQSVRQRIGVVFIIALLIRLCVWWFADGQNHPDEIMQYAQPLNWTMHGDGWMPWEFEWGLRNWLFLAFNGVSFGLAELLGLDAFAGLRLAQLHLALWAAITVLAVHSALRALTSLDADEPDEAAALFGAALYAALPCVSQLSVHTIAEAPNAILALWSVSWISRRQAGELSLLWDGAVGLAMTIAVAIHPPDGLWALPMGLAIVGSLEWRRVLACIAGVAVGVLIAGSVDLYVWGGFAHSTIQHVEYNFVNDHAREHGESPWHGYVTILWSLGGVVLVLLWTAGIASVGLRRVWLVVTVFAPVVALSFVPLKEPRFVYISLALTPVLAGLAYGRLRSRIDPKRALGLAMAAALLLAGISTIETWSAPWRKRGDVVRAQRWVGTQEDLRGVLLGWRYHLSGGQIALGAFAPMEEYYRLRVIHDDYNYLILPSVDIDEPVIPNEYRALELQWLSSVGFEVVHQVGDAEVYRRRRAGE